MGDDHSLLLRPRREAFDYALLPIPIPNLPISTSANLTLFLTNLKRDLLRSTPIDASTVADALNVQRDLSALILDTISSVLPGGNEADRGVVDVCDLVLFLYLQSYKRMVPSRINKDSPSVSDVWPSNSAFDRVLSAMSPVQLVRSNSRRFVPSQADEEIHQLSYLQKHMANMLMLLADPVEGEDDDHMQVLTANSFEHLALLIQFFKHGCGGIPLRKAASFFTSLDQDNPSLSIPATQIHEWILQNITVSLEHFCGKVTEKENDQNNTVDVGDSKGDDSGDHTRSHVVLSLPPVVVEGVSKASVVKQEHDIRGTSVKVINCHESVVYILAPLRYATIHGCSDATVILGAVGKAVRVEHCERLQIIVAAKRICVSNCRECVLYLGVNEKPVFLGDNHKLTVAPYNTFYSQLNEHINRVSLDVTINKWNEPFMLGMIDSLDSLSHPAAGLADVQSELPICLDPDMFTNFVIPNWFSEDSTQPTITNPFELPETYMNSIKKHHMALDDIQQTIRDAQLEENTKRELTCTLHLHFKEWLYASGNIRQLYFLQDDSCSEVGLAQQRI